jgi:hypothetical protein
LEVPDEDNTGALLIAKYIGFEPAQWFVAEPKAESAASSDSASV